jgi:O-antigen/teichoic acid export membrane protein
MVAYYGNYTLVVTKVSSMFDSALGSFTAGVGNLVAEGNNKRSQEVFWEIVALRFFVAGFLIFSVYNFLEPFISLWLGKQYLLDHTILVLLLVTVFISQTRGAVDMFNTAFGHYADTWAAWAELILNVGTTLATAPFLGIAGILLGKIVSTFIIIIVWKPYYLFKVGFRRKMSVYWMQEFKFYFSFAVSVVISTMLFNFIPIDAGASFLKWIAKGVITIPVFCIIYLVLLYMLTQGSRDLTHRVIGMVTKKISR